MVSTLSTAWDTSDTSSSFYPSFTLVSFDISSTYYNVPVKYISTILLLSIRLIHVDSAAPIHVPLQIGPVLYNLSTGNC